MDTSQKYRYLLVEDEVPAAIRFQNLIKSNSSFVSLGVATSGDEARQVITKGGVDLLFLDIELPDMSGFDLLDLIPEDKRPLIVFVTAYDKYALLAFEYFAIDYLLKPFSNDRFRKMITRLETQRSGTPSQNPTGLIQAIRGGTLHGTIVIRTGKRHHFVSIEDVAWVAADGNYCDIHLQNGEVHVHRETISRMMDILPAADFARIHHSYIIRTGFVKGINRILFNDMEVVLRDNTHLKVSRSYKNVARDLIRSRLSQSES